jgi:membrane protein YqaA with SNARE-associated domain
MKTYLSFVFTSLSTHSKTIAHSPYSLLVIYIGSFFNTFIPFFSIPLSILFGTIVIGYPQKRFYLAMLNAFGVALGMGVLFYLLENSSQWMEKTFPSVFSTFNQNSSSWFMTYINQYGLLGIFIISTLPIMIQPLIFLGTMAEISLLPFIIAVWLGRCIKYLVIAQIKLKVFHSIENSISRSKTKKT